MKQETYDKWKSIIDNYDPSKVTVKDYCLNNHINPKSYTRNKMLIYGKVRQNTPSDFMPAVVVPSSKQSSLSLTINGVSLHVDSSIEDSDLKRIIDICSRL